MLVTSAQNYTCDTSNPNSAPVSMGAVATIYDTFCIATRFPDIQRLLPDISLQLSLPANVTGTPTSVPAVLDYTNRGVIIGHLYNLNASTLVFPMDTHENGFFGRVNSVILESADAPSWAPTGQGTLGVGAASWQYYGAYNGTIGKVPTGNVQNVYRINTAGGQAPSTCIGQAAEFGIEYAAEYWFWGSSGKTG